MIYFDQAATSFQKPPEVVQAVLRAMETCASVGRSGHKAAQEAAAITYEARKEAARLFDAQEEQIVFTFNATHGLNMAIRTLVRPGDPVVISGFEHNAVVRPLYQLGAKIKVARSDLFDPAGAVRAFSEAVTEDTRAVICTHVSNVFGCVLPVEEIASLCSARGVPFILDASQSAGVLPVSLSGLRAAFIAMPGHKSLYGPQGTGLLLCGQLPEPLLCGGTGSLSQAWEMPGFLPDRGEAGTHNVPGIAGLLAGLRFLRKTGLAQIHGHELSLLRLLHRELAPLPGLTDFYAGGDLQTGVLSFYVKGMDCEILAQGLSEDGFAVRAGLQCAPLAHQTAGTQESGTVRISVSAFNTQEETVRLAARIGQRIGG